MAGSSPADPSALLSRWGEGDPEAFGELVPIVYDELRRIASAYLRGERPDHTLQTTGLVHEAYLRLADETRLSIPDALHFYALAAKVMRRILVDHSRRRRAQKRGGSRRRVELEGLEDPGASRAGRILAVDHGLAALAEVDPDLARIVELRFFGGFTADEIGRLLGLSVPTVTRRWRTARAWLGRHLAEPGVGRGA